MKIKSERSKKLITTLLRYTSTLPLNDKTIEKALRSDFKDFEDALINFTAEDKNIYSIITFNKKDFKNSALEILTPSEFILQLT